MFKKKFNSLNQSHAIHKRILTNPKSSGSTKPNFLKKTRNIRLLKGFTMTELMVIIAVFGILAWLSSVNFVKPQQKVNFDTAILTLSNDIRAQQTRAMTGDTDGLSAAQNYGVEFATSSYTLFTGLNSTAPNANPYVISLPPEVTLTNISMTDNRVTFSSNSGEVVGNNTKTLRINAANGQVKVITINKYGVVSIN